MKKIALILLLTITAQLTKAQTTPNRVITTGVPFLLVAADARAGGMADQGVATSCDAFSQQWNPSKYAFAVDQQGFSLSYTPYLTNLVNDISLGQVTYYNRINERSAFATTFRYFALGEIELRQSAEDVPQIVKPSELAWDASYALKLSDRFSMSVGGRYISSALRVPDVNSQNTKAAKSFAIDISGFYQSEEVAFDNFNGRWRAGFNFQNMGPKINYDAGTSDDNSANFLPANMRLGGAYDFILDDYNKFTASIEFTKLMVPTPQYGVDLNGDGNIDNDDTVQARQEYNSTNWVSGIFKSFTDAPDGFSEELKEVTYSLAAEYLYQDSFAFRAGYFHESPEKGARKFFTMGAGFRYNVVKVDLSYLFNTSSVRSPLENTLRFSLTFNFGEKYDDF